MLDEFIKKYNGASIDVDGAYGSQCVDLVKFWEAYIGAPITNGNAKDQWKDWNGYTRIPNTVTGVPQTGDIVIWGSTIGAYGHIAVFIEGDTSSFRSFDQNWPVGSPCKIVNHSYNGVLGWLRPNAPQLVEKEAIQFEGEERIYFWAQTPDVAKAWYGDNWASYVKVIKPQVVEKPVYIDKPYPVETIKEVIKYIDKIEYKDSPETLNQVAELRAMIESLTLTEEQKTILDIWSKIKSLFRKG